MMMGALLGGISFHKGLGVVHSLSHALGAEGRVASRDAQRDPAAARLAVQPRRRRSPGSRSWPDGWAWAGAAMRKGT